MANDHLNTPEVWKAIPYFPGYEVSNYGRVRSYRIGSKRGAIAENPHTIKPQNKNRFHLKVSLCRNGKQFQKSVHRLVLETFMGECPIGYECCHNNGNPTNNYLTNLRWDTPTNNSKDKIIHGTIYNNSVWIRCETCHTVFKTPASHSWRKFCSHHCYILAIRRWNRF